MDIWREQWAKMEVHLALEAARARDDVERWTTKVTFSKEYLQGLADGLRRALTLVEAFRLHAPKNEIEQKLDEYSIDEVW